MTDLAIKRNFGLAVRKRRGELKISQEELGGRAGLHRTYITDIERGARNVSLQSIHRLSGALEIGVSELLQAATLGAEAASAQSMRSSLRAELLLATNNSTEKAAIERALAKARIVNPLRTFDNGADLLDFVRGKSQTSTAGRPHSTLLLLDLSLSKVDPLEVLRQIKADPVLNEIRVLILAVQGRNREIAECRRLMADGFLTKPVTSEQIVDLTHKLNLQWAIV